MRKMWKKTLSLLVSLCMVITMMPAVAWAENTCAHVHNTECGYVMAKDCQHECSIENGCITVNTVCVHDCTVGTGCLTLNCEEEHEHGDGCYANACTHEECTVETGCVTQTTSCLHRDNHDSTCGYVAGVACTHECVDDSCQATGILDMANGSVVIEADGYAIEGYEKVNFTGDYTITQTGIETLASYVHIAGGTHNITLDNVDLNGSKTITSDEAKSLFDNSGNATNLGPFMVYGDADVTVILKGDNTLTSSVKAAGLEVYKGSSVTIKVPNEESDNYGKLTATGDNESAGIGGSRWRHTGSVTILSGTIDAKCGGAYASGIGPGRAMTAEAITISGGVIKNRCGNTSDRYNYSLGTNGSKLVTTLTITGGVIDTNGIAGTALNISGGTIIASKTTPVEYSTLSVTGGNIITTATLPSADINERKLAKIYVVDSEGDAQKDTEVEVTVNTVIGEEEKELTWKAITDSDGIITTYLMDADVVNNTEKLPDGWLIGGTCVCDTAPLTFGDMAEEVDVYSADMVMDVVVRGECDMPIHKDVAVVCVIESVTLEVGTSVNKDDYASYADGKLTLKPAGNANNYTVKLRAMRDAYDTPVYHEMKVWASNEVGRKLDVSNGPITVTAGTDTNEGKVVYTQGANTFALEADTPVTIVGTYELNSGNAIKITNCSPTIVLKDVTIESKANVGKDAESTILIDGEETDEVKLILSGTNKIIRGDSTNSGQKIGQFNGIEIRNAALTIDCTCENGVDCKDTDCADKLIVELGNGRSAAIGSRFLSDYGTDNVNEPEGFTLNVEGGQIEASTENFGAAIGTSWISGKTLTNKFYININDGYVKAVAADLGVAIGSGRSNTGPNEGIMNVNISGGVAEAVSISVKHRNGEGETNSTSEAINASNVTVSGDADVTVKGLLQAKSVEIAGEAELDMQKKEGWEEDHGFNPGGSISNGYQWTNDNGEVITVLGTVEVKVSGDAKLTTEGGINGTLTTSGNAVAEINGIVPVAKGSGVDSSLGGVTGNVNVGAGSFVSVTETIASDIIVEGGGTFNGAAIPESVTSVTIPAGGDLSVDEEGNITLPAGADVTVDEDGTVALPEGSVVEQADGTEITLTSGGSLDSANGAVTMYEGSATIKKENGETTTVVIPEGSEGTVNGSTVTLPTGSTVTLPNGSDVTVSNGGSVDLENGTVTQNKTPSAGYRPSSKKYSVSIDGKDMENGSVKLSNSSAKRGATVTITVTPDAGYMLDKLTVTDKDGNKLALKNVGNGKYSFTMPRGGVEVDASFKEFDGSEPSVDTKETAIVLTIDSTLILIDGEYVVNDVAPIIRNERTVLPIRVIAEALGAAVTWNEAEQTVTIVKGDTTIVLYIGQAFALVNGDPVQLDAPAFIENGRTYLPLRFIMENLGASVVWDGLARTVTILG